MYYQLNYTGFSCTGFNTGMHVEKQSGAADPCSGAYKCRVKKVLVYLRPGTCDLLLETGVSNQIAVF